MENRLSYCCQKCFYFNHNLPEFWYPDAIFPLFLCSYVFSAGKMHKRSTDLPCWPVEQIFGLLTSLKDGYEVELLPRVLCFLSQLTWILISHRWTPSSSLLLFFIGRNVVRTVNKSLCWSVELLTPHVAEFSFFSNST